MSNNLGKNILKQEAKKIYKTNIKNVPKRNRMPFGQFFKKYCEMKKAEVTHNHEEHDHEHESEDFNFDEMVNINNELELEAAVVPPEITEEKHEEKTEEVLTKTETP